MQLTKVGFQVFLEATLQAQDNSSVLVAKVVGGDQQLLSPAGLMNAS
jgi:hypothetical protein